MTLQHSEQRPHDLPGSGSVGAGTLSIFGPKRCPQANYMNTMNQAKRIMRDPPELLLAKTKEAGALAPASRLTLSLATTHH
jgi:hypothetical protein